MRRQFTFYESFFKAICRIKKKADRADAYDIICNYALNQIEPDLESVSDSVAIVFDLLRPVLEKANAKAKSGEKGGTKPKANGKQNESKPQAKAKQTASYIEGEVEREVEEEVEEEIENILPPPEVRAEPVPASAPPVAELKLNDGSLYPVYQPDVDKWAGLYPAVDVLAELRKMVGWCDANPTKRKTKGGVQRFINAWLAKEQDKGGVSPTAPVSRWGKPEIPKGASGQLGEAEMEAIRRVLAEE